MYKHKTPHILQMYRQCKVRYQIPEPECLGGDYFGSPGKEGKKIFK